MLPSKDRLWTACC